jgi:hypothetical protein
MLNAWRPQFIRGALGTQGTREKCSIHAPKLYRVKRGGADNLKDDFDHVFLM